MSNLPPIVPTPNTPANESAVHKAEIGVIAKNQGSVFDITSSRFGAVEGASDNTTQILDAMDTVANTGGAVYVPAGVWNVDALAITDFSTGGNANQSTRFLMYGDGLQSRLVGNTSSPILTIGNSGGSRIFDIEIRDLFFECDSTAVNGIKLVDTTMVKLTNLGIKNATGDGILYDDDSYGPHTVSGCHITDCGGNGIHSTNSTSNGNALRIKNNRLLRNVASGIYIESGKGISINDNDIELNENGGIRLKGVGGVSIIGNYIEAHTLGTADPNKSNILLESVYQGASITGNYFNVGGVYGLYCEASLDLSVHGNYFFAASTGTGIYMADGVHASVCLLGNRFNGLTTKIRHPVKSLSTGYQQTDLEYTVALPLQLGDDSGTPVGLQDAYISIPFMCHLLQASTILLEALGGASDEIITIANNSNVDIDTITIAGSSTETTRDHVFPTIDATNTFSAGDKMRIRGNQANDAAWTAATIFLTFIKR